MRCHEGNKTLNSITMLKKKKLLHLLCLPVLSLVRAGSLLKSVCKLGVKYSSVKTCLHVVLLIFVNKEQYAAAHILSLHRYHVLALNFHIFNRGHNSV